MRAAALRLLLVLTAVVTAGPLPADEMLNRARAITESEAEALARLMVEAELAKMADMTSEQSWSYLRTEWTQFLMSHVAAALEAYRSKRGRYPAAGSIGELESALFTEFTSEVPKVDRWGTEFRYVVSRDGKSYRLISAGSDTIFDETSWGTPGPLASSDEDAVVENGRPVRVWTTETQPGLGVLAKLRPDARARLAEADRRLEVSDQAGALAAYMEAVELDPAAADLDRINRYAVLPYSIAPAPPPPPPPPPSARSTPSAQPPSAPMTTDAMEKRGEEVHIAALRQYLRIHPGERDAITSLATLLPAEEADTLMGELVQQSPEDPEVYEARGRVRSQSGRFMEALADYEMASRLDGGNAERFYMLGVGAYEAAAKQTGQDETQKRALIARGLVALERAGSLRADYFEPLVFRNLLLREQAKLEEDPVERQKLIDQADALRQKARDLANARRAEP